MTNVKIGTIKKHGPFTWTYTDDKVAREAWTLTSPYEGATFFCLVNYGGKPGDGFAGWKLVSGGPFDEAGAYDSFDTALKGVTPWLMKYMLADVNIQKRQLDKRLLTVRRFKKLLSNTN